MSIREHTSAFVSSEARRTASITFKNLICGHIGLVSGFGSCYAMLSLSKQEALHRRLSLDTHMLLTLSRHTQYTHNTLNNVILDGTAIFV